MHIVHDFLTSWHRITPEELTCLLNLIVKESVQNFKKLIDFN